MTAIGSVSIYIGSVSTLMVGQKGLVAVANEWEPSPHLITTA